MNPRRLAHRAAAASAALLATLFAPLPASGQAPADERLEAVIDRLWEFSMRESPLWATRTGDHRFNDRLPRVSQAYEDRRAEFRREALAELDAIDAAELSPAASVNLAILRRQLIENLASYQFREYLMPVDGRSGFHISFPELRRNVPLATVTDYENYISRLRQFQEYARGHMNSMRQGIRAGVTQPAVILEGHQRPIEAHIVGNPEQSLLYEPFLEFPSTVPDEERERLREAGRQAISQSVVPAYTEFLQFMEEEYVPSSRATIGASALPEGREYYRRLVRRFTTLDLTPEEIHAIGLREVERIREEMETIIDQVGFEGDFAQFVAHLREDPQFYAETEEALLAHTAKVLKTMDGRLPELFGKLPRMPYGLKPVPDYRAPREAAAYYERPSGDGTKAGFFFLNTFALDSRPLYAIESLALHEAVPGHHLQLALQQEMTSLPEFRKYSGFTVFVEGWALYAERLGLEAGFYADPYSEFGRLSMEMWRACRLVVDTGIHYFGWSRQRAVDYMRENSGLSMHNIQAEVDRYIGWPGQALAYKIGELKIRELRALAEEELGPEFDIREFHDVVLAGGSVPLDVLEENVRAWIDGR